MLPEDLQSAQVEMCAACDAGNLERAKQLLAWGVGPNVEIGGRSLLLRAATSANHNLVRVLLRAGARPTMIALVGAVVSGNRHSVERIADELHFAGVDPAAYPWGAVLGQKEFLEALTPEIARWLVQQKIDLEETDTYGRNLRHLAEMWARPEVARILAELT